MGRTHISLAGAVFVLLLHIALPVSPQGNIPGDPWEFTAEDIAPPPITPGDTTYAPDPAATFGTYTVTTHGGDVGGTADSFRFLYFEASGDFSISVCLLEISGLGEPSGPKAGVMVRQNNTPGSPHFSQSIERGAGGFCRWRPTQDADAPWAGAHVPAPAYPFWSRTRREGDTFYGDYSLDGENWTHQAAAEATVAMTDPVLVGIFLCSRFAATTTTASFTDFRIDGAGPGTLPVPGEDQYVYAGDTVTLDGSNSIKTDTYHWEQVILGSEPAVSLANPDPPDGITTFTAPPDIEQGVMLTFRLTVTGETGTASAETRVFVRAAKPPPVPPGNFRTHPGNLSFRLEWDPLIDAEDYGVGFKLGPGMYFWFWTENTYYDLLNLQEGQATVVAVRGRNTRYGEGAISDDITLVPMRNYALPDTLGGTEPPDSHVYVISHYSIDSMNDTVIDDDNNDSWDGLYKEEDYWGYTWPSAILMDHVVYFTGNMFGDGGWLTDLKVQYTKNGTTWIDVPTTIVPPYSFVDDRQGRGTYERYDMEIPALLGTGIRIYGTPGGMSAFSSIAELEIYSDHVTLRPFLVQGVDAEVPEGNTATLDGSFTFSTRGDIASYAWEQVSGTTVNIINADQETASFDAPAVDADEDLVFRLTANDGTESLSDEEVLITVKNLVTTAVAGPDQTVEEGTAVTLDGSGSLSTTGTLTYQWTQTDGIPVTINNANEAVANFDAPVIWDYTETVTVRLDVDDGGGGTSSDEVAVEIQNSLASAAWPLEGAPGTEYFQDVLHLGNNATDRILAPLNIQSGADHLAAFGGSPYVEPVPGEAYDFTDTGVTVTRNPMVWTPIHSDSGMFGNESLDDFQQFYHIYILSPEDRDVRWHRRHDDEIRVWNNGVLVSTDDTWDNNAERTTDGFAADGTGLSEGLNSITMMFEEGGGGNWIALGVTDQSNIPFDDLYYSFGPTFLLADAYAVRELPLSYQAGGNLEVTLSVRVNDDNKPSNVTVSEPIPGGLTVVHAGGGTVVGGSLNWSFSGGSVATQMINYTLGVPAGTGGALNFTGTVSFPTTDGIKGDNVVYEVPSAPQNLDVQMLLSAYLSWSASPEEGVIGYRVYRRVNAGAWEEVALVSTNSYEDTDVVELSTYNYHVAAVNAGGVEGPVSDASGEEMITMEVRQAEDFNYGGGEYPYDFSVTVAAVEAIAEDDLAAGNDFWHPNKGGDATTRVYRPLDDIGIHDPATGTGAIGWVSPGSWWRYTFDVPEAGWLKFVFRIATHSSRASADLAVYWDESLVGILTFANNFIMTYEVLEEQIETTVGQHTLRLQAIAEGTSDCFDFDEIGVGFNWTKPTREDLFFDDFEVYTNLYSYDDLVNPDVGWEYTVVNGAGVPEGAWRLWNTAGDPLGTEAPAIDAMTSNYVITDSDLGGAVEHDEELITPAIDATQHRRCRLDFNYNYRTYPDDTVHLQIAEVDIRSSDDGVTWGDWTTLQRWDTSTVADQESGSLQVDISALADGKHIQIRFHYYDANFDYWFAVDDIRVSGDALPPQGGEILTIGYVAGVADLTWEAFGDGNYTVDYTNDLTSGTWDPVPGVTWPVTDTNWSGNIDTIFAQGVYLRVRSE